jgi:ubiquinone/menaquinone biosynthesis C-methylase UbiE
MSYSPLDIKYETGNGSADAGAFEKLYVQLRKKEQRLYTDEEVRNLPKIAATHLHFKEWLFRKRSCDRLIEYLEQKNKPLHILEIGCGNGWLSAQLAENISGQVVGMDINKEELTQAARVFSDISNLKFISGDIRSAQLEHNSYDIIVFAASLQYFPSLKEIMQSAFQYLRAGGEVHIMDTIFYKKNNVDAARLRTKDYYTTLGFPEATDYYYHHCIEDLKNFSAKILYDPVSWMHKFSKNKCPFFWVCIKKPGNPESNP